MSKRRYENMKLNGMQFIFDNKVKMPYPMNYRYNNIWYAYERPSRTKEAIWEDWKRWFIENGGHCGINSKNSNFFSISGVVRDSKTDKMYRCEITASYNRCYEIEEN